MSKHTFTDYTAMRHDDGTVHSFKPGDTVPAWAKKQITNDAIIIDDEHAAAAAAEAEQAAADARAAAEAAAAEQAQQVADAEDAARKAAAAAAGSDSTPPELTSPPKGGAGSSRDAWIDYAKAALERAGKAVEIDDDDTRDDIIAALAEAGIPTEANTEE